MNVNAIKYGVRFGDDLSFIFGPFDSRKHAMHFGNAECADERFTIVPC